MKKLISVLLAVMLVVVLATTAFAAGAPTVSISSATTSGENVTLTVSISNNPGFVSGTATITYDPSVLTLVALNNGLFTGVVNPSFSSNSGVVNHVVMGDLTPVTGDGVLFTAVFQVKSMAADATNVSVKLNSLRAEDGTNYAGATSTGTVTLVCNHSWGTGTVTKDATCEDAGIMTYTCSKCNKPKTETINKLGHKFSNWATVTEATCTTDGEEARTCATCGKKETNTLTATGHDWDNADCESAKTCKTCGAKEGAALGHDWADATCTAPKTCKTCGATDGAALGHNWADATCTAPKTCKTCGATDGAALGHDWENATCLTAKTCKTCGETDGEALGHKEVSKVTIPATCTDEGEKIYFCSRCEETLKTEVIPTTDHDYTDYVDNGNGKHTRYCTCGAKGAIEVHDYRLYSYEKPTTTKEGKKVEACQCGDKVITIVPKLTSADAELDDVPPTGDITMQITLGAVAMVSMVAAAAFVFKRKIAK